MIEVTATLNGVTKTINGNGQHITGSISQEVGAIHSFSFEILPENIGFDLIQSRKTIIRATNTTTGRTEFSGRVLLGSETMSNTGLVSKSVTCESFLGYLCDSVQPYKAEELYTLNDFIDLVLTNHNDRVEQSKWIFRGNVDVDVAGTGQVYKGLQYQTTFETLKSKLVDIYGGELEIVEVDGIMYLNYLKQIGTTRATEIELGRNMQSASREVSPLNIVSRITPLGAKLKMTVENEDGSITEQETEERLTLKGFTTPEGVLMENEWVDDEEKIDAIGVICGTLDCPDITEQINLYKRVKEFIANENRVNLSHTLTALDLREIGLDLDSLNCADSYPVENKLIGLDEILRITKKTIDINAPYKGSITIGEKKGTLSSIQATENEKINITLQQMQGNIQNVTNSANSVTSSHKQLATNLTQTISEIVREALATYVTTDALGKTKVELENKITDTADGTLQEFSKTITETEKTIDGNIATKFEELNAYIRYYMDDNGKPVIELGRKSDNADDKDKDMICKITNDRISFVQNDDEVAYISSNRLYIKDATILSYLHIGSYAFVPIDDGTNDGSVSLIKIGG